MGNIMGSEKAKFNEHTSANTSLQTPPRTPTLNGTAAQTLAVEIRDIHHALTELSDLRPGDEINALLTRLVSLCVKSYSSELIDHFFSIEGVPALCEKLRPLCATAEGELERFWASKIISESVKSQATPSQTKVLLHTFPYHQNYLDLSRIECATLSAFLPSPTTPPRNIAFVGSGPLPLTSLCILDLYPSVHVHNIDRDTTGLTVSRDLCSRLGYDGRMSFACVDVSAEESVDTETRWVDFEVVFLAALVGMDTSLKLAILEGLARKLKPGTLVVARSAKGLRGVLYPMLDIGEDIQSAGLDTLIEVHPWTEVVNSVIVFRVNERWNGSHDDGRASCKDLSV